ncbi:D-glucuronyl C5-epimerase B isoform X1 [Anopheles merus]|uniref:heparosan-N-sulfate-glucuronate 5-epimerase n=1 Tax=Anopheles merus TaxID=30066 RepID=A0A182VF35_ANOME|nr:D-glucuronyl C5-epimerase B isoform X1 [Anopheles merus]
MTALKNSVGASANDQKARFFLVIMRLNLKFLLISLCVTVALITFALWANCGVGHGFVPKWPQHHGDSADSPFEQTEEIDCIINQEYAIGCRKEGDEVYLPFSFLQKYFDVYGSLNVVDGSRRFDWTHSYGKVNYPKGAYDPRGIFMYFENYNVEMRDRVKCISAIDGVPISTQWESQGYFYATQIAQFGLSHYSKNLTEPEPRRKTVEDGERETATWIVPKGSSMNRTIDRARAGAGAVLSFSTGKSFDTAVVLPMDHVLDLVLSVDVLLKPNSTLCVTLQNRETQKLYHVYYILADLLIGVQDENIYYGIGLNCTGGWKHLTRDLFVDLQKGLPQYASTDKRRKMRRTELKVVEISLLGNGSIDNLTLSTSEHISHFYDAAEWLIRHQDPSTGGWPIPVRRKLGSGFGELARGWYSAMAQGHAISLLARAYYHSKGDKRYLRAALDGLKLFRIPSYQGGVLATFLGKYAWYEEYPTTPHSFVLNGFIYSLLGLYDLNSTAPANQSNEAAVLFEQGMASLKKMLLLYDTGSGTSYDLRHFTLGIAPNLARWDYHATHVNQLLLLATIDPDPLISQTAERWKNYMVGKRAPHN